jgi:hypothetical protein
MAHPPRRKMNISILIPFAIVALVFGALIWKKVHDSRKVRPVPQVNEPATGRKAILFFVADGSRLAREARELESCDGPEACLKDLLDELVSGPVGALEEALPAAAEVNAVHLAGDLVVVDLNQAFADEMPTGSSAEMLAVYSIVNTVCVNYPAIARVKVTVAGKEKAALNHLDLSDALLPDYSLEETPSVGQPAAQPHDKQPAVKKGQP